MLPIAFLTHDGLDVGGGDDGLAARALNERGYRVDSIPWQARVEWRVFRAVVVRSTWDYQKQPDAFLGTLREIQRYTLLENHAQTVAWNIRKDYLGERFPNVARIPTLYGRNLSEEFLLRAFSELGVEEVLVKPLVGAGAVDIVRLSRAEQSPPGATISRRDALALYADREFLVQPFLRSIAERGELSLIFFGGRFSHAVRKTPALHEFRVQEEYGGLVELAWPDPAEAALADAVLQAITPVPLYARVDLVRLDSGEPALIEVELTEPALFFHVDASAPARFADELDRRLFGSERVSPAR